MLGVNASECLVLVGGAVVHKLVATLPSVCPRAAVATDVAYHHRYDWANGVHGICKAPWVSRKALYKCKDYYYYYYYIFLDTPTVEGQPHHLVICHLARLRTRKRHKSNNKEAYK